MLIQGKWHPEGSAAQFSAALQISGDYFTLKIEDGSTYSGEIQDLKVSERLGNVQRKLSLSDGSIFATSDNDSVDKVFIKQNKIFKIIHALESKLSWVLIALVFTAGFTFSFFKWGVPWTSSKIAHALPHKTNEIIAANSLEFMDKYFFDDSQLDPELTSEIRERFNSKLIHLDKNNTEIDYKLHFRDWNVLGIGIPNALALPSGDIIMTDEFVELSESSDEIDSVLLHEIGHVVNRHSLEMLIEGTMVTTIVMMVTGDSNGLADMGIGLGSLMLSSNYSRGHESEADLYAFEKMLEAGIDPQAFSDIMQRITMHMEEVDEKKKEDGQKDIFDYLSSHPSTKERIEKATLYSSCFKQGLVICDPKVRLE